MSDVRRRLFKGEGKTIQDLRQPAGVLGIILGESPQTLRTLKEECSRLLQTQLIQRLPSDTRRPVPAARGDQDLSALKLRQDLADDLRGFLAIHVVQDQQPPAVLPKPGQD